MTETKKPKFEITFEELLPKNERTKAIMATREALENQKKAEEEEVIFILFYL